MKIIPTPEKHVFSADTKPLLGFSNIEFSVNIDDTVSFALSEIHKIYTVPSGNERLVLSYSDDEFFLSKNASEQGYILTRKRGAVTVYAKSSVGLMYGLMTLLQLFGDAPGEIEIYDRPAIRYRGNMNTLWAESGVWSYDFGDGKEAAMHRLYDAVDCMARAKLNLIYADAFGFGCDRFDGYNDMMTSLSEYAGVRGIKIMAGGYGMGYGQSGSYHFSGKVFRNRYPYPDGELYDCIGTCIRDEENTPIDQLQGRTYGTCLTNTALTDDKIAEIREYLKKTGVRVLYMHNVDADEIHEPLWLARCVRCKARYPDDSLYTKEGAAGAFADFYDYILDALLSEFPDLIICPISPGYAYHTMTSDYSFEKCVKFWSSIMRFMRHKDGVLPMFRELFIQKNDKRLRFDMINETMPKYSCAFFSGGDGFYTDKIYTPSAPYIKAMRGCELIICANGGALQKTTQYANAEYLWNPNSSAFYDLQLLDNYEDMTKHYDALRRGEIRPEGIWGEGGLLDTSCKLIYGDEHGARIADVFRLHGERGECPVFTPCSVEIYTHMNTYNLLISWDDALPPEKQIAMRERFVVCAGLTRKANEIFSSVLSADRCDLKHRNDIEFLHNSTNITAQLCEIYADYMDIYIRLDEYFRVGGTLPYDATERCERIIERVNKVLLSFENDGYEPFDIFGGIYVRREEVFEFAAYSAGQMIKSIKENQRQPSTRRSQKENNWW